MNHARRALVNALWLAASAFTLPTVAAPAEPVAAVDARAVRAVVEAQLAAFAADDAKRAFSYAAPSIRDMFGTPDRFLAMVRTSYPAVYRAAGAIFLAPERLQGQVLQGVQLTDASGVLWIAVYQLERQPDKNWRISGCNVQPSSAKMT